MKSLARFLLPGFLAGWVVILVVGALFDLQFRSSPSLSIWTAWLLLGAITVWGTWMAWSRHNRTERERGQIQISVPTDAAIIKGTPLYKKILGAAAGFCCGIFVTIGLAFCIGNWLGLKSSNAGPFHRTQMESLVAQVRSQKFDGDKRFGWTEVSGTPTLLPETGTAPGYVARWISAERGKDQYLKVVIVTNDEGHAGTYGFAFSDVPLPPTQDSNYPEDKGRLQLDVPGGVCYSYPRMQIDAHWWEVFDDLE